MVNPEPLGDIYLDSYKHCFDTDALCAVNVDKHGVFFFAPNLVILAGKVLKKKKNVAKSGL